MLFWLQSAPDGRARVCCAQTCLGFNCSSISKVSVDDADTVISDGLGTTCCQMPPCSAPGLSITTASPLVIRPATETSIQAVASLAMCAVPEGAALEFSWVSNATAVQLDAATANSNQLRLAPFTFAAGFIQLEVTAWLSSAPAQNTTATMILQVEQSPEVQPVMITGSQFAQGPEQLPCAAVRDIILQHLFD